MGLDISLIKIVKEPVNELNWLPAEENPELKEKYHDYLTDKVLKFENEPDLKSEGFYFEELSYQRKGVKSSFYETYKNDELLFAVNDLEELKKHILDDYLETFKIGFIDKFQEGNTIILMDY